ncbi:FAD-dependent oxidoreductase [Nocardia panacis]|uniref:FAD-dependent oxidoreductase n=1 Tax=Nocardia panacis TaxID=2340916 RepID=A0A3A4KMD5_9NOCA|nr:FAD-dependent monooxygenase [Nocardia panacis]RJO75196.1 FAD-dependent oxidoreductase [Nocardia panacis]
MPNSRNVLISGASIAGPALAYWLQRNGLRPTVVERAPAPRPGGNGVDLRGASIGIAERMGILPTLRARATDIRDLVFVDAAGDIAATIPTSSFNAPGDLEIRRGDLSEALHAATGDVEYRYDDTVNSLTQQPDGVAVTFGSGREEMYDLVVGADGLHSRVRNLAVIPEAEATHHLGYYFAVGEVEPDFTAPGAVTLYNEPGRAAGVYRSAAHQDATAIFFFREPLALDFDHHDREAQIALLRRYLDSDGWHVRELVDAAAASAGFYLDAVSQIRIPHWTSGRVALVGDAGYCATLLSGAGATLALEGAHRLAIELAATADHRVAFARYEAAMRPIVTKRQRATRVSGALLVPAARSHIRLRNRLAKLLTTEPIAAALFRQSSSRAA